MKTQISRLVFRGIILTAFAVSCARDVSSSRTMGSADDGERNSSDDQQPAYVNAVDPRMPLNLLEDQIEMLKAVLPVDFKYSLVKPLKEYMNEWYRSTAKELTPANLFGSFMWFVGSAGQIVQNEAACVVPEAALEWSKAVGQPIYLVCKNPAKNLTNTCQVSPFCEKGDAICLIGCSAVDASPFPSPPTGESTSLALGGGETSMPSVGCGGRLGLGGEMLAAGCCYLPPGSSPTGGTTMTSGVPGVSPSATYIVPMPSFPSPVPVAAGRSIASPAQNMPSANMPAPVRPDVASSSPANAMAKTIPAANWRVAPVMETVLKMAGMPSLPAVSSSVASAATTFAQGVMTAASGWANYPVLNANGSSSSSTGGMPSNSGSTGVMAGGEVTGVSQSGATNASSAPDVAESTQSSPANQHPAVRPMQPQAPQSNQNAAVPPTWQESIPGVHPMPGTGGAPSLDPNSGMQSMPTAWQEVNPAAMPGMGGTSSFDPNSGMHSVPVVNQPMGVPPSAAEMTRPEYGFSVPNPNPVVAPINPPLNPLPPAQNPELGWDNGCNQHLGEHCCTNGLPINKNMFCVSQGGKCTPPGEQCQLPEFR